LIVKVMMYKCKGVLDICNTL